MTKLDKNHILFLLHGMLVVLHWLQNEDNEWSAFRMYPKITYWLYLFVRGRWSGIRSSYSLTLSFLQFTTVKYQVPKPLCSVSGIFTAFSSSQVAWSQRASNSQSQIVRASMRRKWISAPQHRCATESSRGLELRQIEMITMPRATCYYLESKHVFQFTLTGMWKKRSEILIFSNSLLGFYPFSCTLVLQSNDRVPDQVRSSVSIENAKALPLELLRSKHSSASIIFGLIRTFCLHSFFMILLLELNHGFD